MATEQEELKLIVTLVDNASPGIDKIVEKTKEMGGPQVREAHRRMSEGAKELTAHIAQMTGGFNEAFKSLGMFRLGLAGGAAGVIGLGFAIKEGISGLKEYTDELRKMQQVARNIGVNPGQFKALIEQFNAVGVATEDAMQGISDMAAKIAELSRVGSQLRLHFLHEAGPSPEAVRNMQDFLDKLVHASSEAQRLNLIREAGENVFNNARRQGYSELEAANRRAKFWADLGYSDKLAALKQAKQATAEEQKWNNERMENSTKFSTSLDTISGKLGTIKEFFKDPWIDPNGPLAQSLNWFSNKLDEIIGKLSDWKREGERRTDLDKVLPETNPLREGYGPWRQRLAQRNWYMEHPDAAIPKTTQEAEERANKKLQEENTEATKKLDQTTQELIQQLKQGYNPISYLGGGFNRGMIQNASFTTGGDFGGGGAGGNYGYGPAGGGRPGAPYGSSVGPGSGRGAGDTPAAGGGGGASSLEPQAAGAAGGGGEGWGHEGIAAMRAPLMAEVNKDPATKQLLHQMMSTEGGGAATVEALFNRTAMIRQKVPGYSIRDELHSGFYGPINKGIAQRRAIGAKEYAQQEKQIAQVAQGSDIIQGRTDQGTYGDPNASGPGRVTYPGMSRSEIYNFWKGSRRGRAFTYADTSRFAAEIEARKNFDQPALRQMPEMPTEPPTFTDRDLEDARKQLDKSSATKVEGSGKITVDVNGPKGTKVGAEGKGIFKDVEINRQTQMEPARKGPETMAI
jgi:hypothetical protein